MGPLKKQTANHFKRVLDGSGGAQHKEPERLAQTQMRGTWLVMGLEILLREVAGGFQVLSLRGENLGGSGSYPGEKKM